MPSFQYRGRRNTADASLRITQLVRAILALDENAAVSVSQLDCGEPACGGAETVILVMRPNAKTEMAKVKRPMGAVTEEMLRAALAAISEPASRPPPSP